jgi:hypothetical protein
MLILTDIPAGKEEDLGRTLEKIRTRLINNRNNNVNVSFHNTQTVHYAAWMILPGVKRPGKSSAPARLAFETNYDGCLANHLTDLVANCRAELDEVYSSFPGYPPQGSEGLSVEQFLSSQFNQTNSSVNRSAFYVALPGRSLEDIKNAIAVYDEAKNFVDNPANRSTDPEQVRRALSDHFKNNARVQPQRFPITQKGLRRLFAINMAVLTLLSVIPLVYLISIIMQKGLWGLFAINMNIAVLMLLCLIPLIYLLSWGVIDVMARYFEKKEEREERKQKVFDPTYRPPEYAHLDLGRQNHLCTYTTVKPGWFRMFVIKRALWLGPILFNYFFILGKLDQMSTVHFARWTLTGRQLIFYGNYDGSWSSYLTDFSDEAWGVNLVWGNTIGFPVTKYIVGAGARDLEAFQEQAATHYAPAPVFYSAYRNHSLVNLLRYLEFRDGLLEEIGA